ncbi:MAG: hypothetical protein Q8T03_01250 [Bacteroidota bacterium]|nr:hypothetical protein [Bacteroidota bacterium]
MEYEEFYSQLGMLLYAVADIDGVITPQEKNKLKSIIKDQLIPEDHHKDKYGTYDAYYAEMEFDFLDEEIGDAETAFTSFIDYVDNHYTAFDNKMIKLGIRVAEELANAYRGTNKKKRLLVKRLKKNIKDIELKKKEVISI